MVFIALIPSDNIGRCRIKSKQYLPMNSHVMFFKTYKISSPKNITKSYLFVISESFLQKLL